MTDLLQSLALAAFVIAQVLFNRQVLRFMRRQTQPTPLRRRRVWTPEDAIKEQFPPVIAEQLLDVLRRVRLEYGITSPDDKGPVT